MEFKLEKTYNPSKVEDKIYDFWLKGDYFKAKIDKNKKPFTIVIPPPNVTGKLHMGHALDETMQDIIVRFKRMQGFCALWVPGVDHASIATEAKISEELRNEGICKEDLGREKFLKRAWAWKEKYGDNIINQLKKLGASCDWSRQRFTMDEGSSKAVKEFFVRLYKKGLIYRGERIINWCPKCKTSISDSEVDFEEHAGHFWHIKYKIVDENEVITVATTRPETMFGDTAVAVNPNDERYKHLIGKTAIIPIVNRKIPIIADDYVDITVGTGALKITPAHDPHDFEVGTRHNLPVICVMDECAVMNEKSGKYSGLDRFTARKQLVEDLKNGGYIEKIKEITHNVGSCYRCKTIVEPRISKQWFVKMESLAKPAIDCVKNGKTNFIPDRFSKIYYHWMENIKDWCISRQLWWGHRIPVWYCEDCGEMIVSKEDTVRKCYKCGSPNLHQDEDTLDTWFSSGLWPFSVFGWPEKTSELEYFYPTNVLVTGYDIIFFWVAKMIFSSLEVLGKEPFENVLIHGLVRDAQGRKMSKSLGNGIDPMDIIQKYGADALRFSLVLGTSPGNDMRFYDEKIESARNFANKIWNAARFVHMNVDNLDLKSELPDNLDMVDRWIVSKFNKVIRDITSDIDKFELGIAAQNLYDFIWDDFCDWYIEFSKISGKKEVLLWVLKNTLKLLHPFMPFITEEIWHSFDFGSGSIMISDYPVFDSSYICEESEKKMDILMSVVKSVRNLRREMNVPNGKKTAIYVETKDKNTEAIICDYQNAVCKFAFGNELKVSPKFDLNNAASAVNDYAKVYILIDDLVDVKSELLRLTKELKEAEEQLKNAKERLANKSFVSKAPQKVVDGAKEMAVKLEHKIENLKKSIEKFSN